MSHLHDDDRIIAVQQIVICFSWEKQVSVAPKDVYRPSIFLFPHHFPLALTVNKSPCGLFNYHPRSTDWRENRGSVNRLRLTSKCLVRKYDHWIYQSVQVLFISKWQRQLNNMLRLVMLYVDTSLCASLVICCWRETLKNDTRSRNNETPVISWMQILHLSISTETNKNSQINDSVCTREVWRARKMRKSNSSFLSALQTPQMHP